MPVEHRDLLAADIVFITLALYESLVTRWFGQSPASPSLAAIGGGGAVLLIADLADRVRLGRERQGGRRRAGDRGLLGCSGRVSPRPACGRGASGGAGACRGAPCGAPSSWCWLSVLVGLLKRSDRRNCMNIQASLRPMGAGVMRARCGFSRRGSHPAHLDDGYSREEFLGHPSLGEFGHPRTASQSVRAGSRTPDRYLHLGDAAASPPRRT